MQLIWLYARGEGFRPCIITCRFRAVGCARLGMWVGVVLCVESLAWAAACKASTRCHVAVPVYNNSIGHVDLQQTVKLFVAFASVHTPHLKVTGVQHNVVLGEH